MEVVKDLRVVTALRTQLDDGEAHAIALAMELGDVFIILDDTQRCGSKAFLSPQRFVRGEGSRACTNGRKRGALPAGPTERGGSPPLSNSPRGLCVPSGMRLSFATHSKKARRVARQMGLKVIGTVGVILRAKQKGVIAAIRPVLIALGERGFRMAPALYGEALRLAGEETSR